MSLSTHLSQAVRNHSRFAPQPERFAIERPIGELVSHTYHVTLNTLTNEVVRTFERSPELPGVLLLQEQRLAGMVSRYRCLELLSHRYGVDLFLNRPIGLMHSHLNTAHHPLPEEMPIHDAVQLALNRPAEQRYEPIIVDDHQKGYRLLDVHVLLLAQSRQLGNANTLIQQQFDIGRALSSTLDLPQVFDLILQHLAEVIPYDRAGVMLAREDRLEFAAWKGFPPDANPANLRMPIHSNALFQQIYRSQEPLLLSRLEGREEWIFAEGLPHARSWLGLPLLHSGQVMGLLSLVRTTNRFYEEDLEVAKSFADQAAIALKNAMLYDEVKCLNQNLERMVQERTEALQLAYTHLEQLDHAKSDFITIASHELRTPLTVISGYAQMLKSDNRIQADTTHASYTNGILNGLKRLQEIVGSLLDMARIDHRQLEVHPEPVSLAALFGCVNDDVKNALQERNLSLTIHELDHLPPVQGDDIALRKAFYHLAVNAIKYTPDGGQISVSAKTLQGEQSGLNKDAIQITVRDTGIGIDPAHLELIFNKFYQTGKAALHSSGTTKYRGGGPGLGLAIVRGIAEAHGGRVWAESPGQDEKTLPGSQFHVLLPVYGNAPPKAPL